MLPLLCVQAGNTDSCAYKSTYPEAEGDPDSEAEAERHSDSETEGYSYAEAIFR